MRHAPHGGRTPAPALAAHSAALLLLQQPCGAPWCPATTRRASGIAKNPYRIKKALPNKQLPPCLKPHPELARSLL